MNQMLIYQIAIPLLAVIFLLLIWNEIYKRGGKIAISLANDYTWNRCFINGDQGVIIVKLNLTSKKNKSLVFVDSGLEIVRDFKLPAPTEHVPTIERVDDHTFTPADFLFSKQKITLSRKGETRTGFDVFLTNQAPKKGKRLVVEYYCFDEKWRRHSHRLTIYMDRSNKQVVV